MDSERTPPKVMVVVGMGRSCTSGIAGALHDAGWPMGPRLIGPGKGNPKGHYEDRPLIDLNDAMLRAIGCSWQAPPIASYDLTPLYRAPWPGRIRAYIAARVEQSGHGQWGMKDPRLTLLWHLWWPIMSEFDIDWILVKPDRDAAMVADSLVRRDGMPEPTAAALAFEYQRRMPHIRPPSKQSVNRG